VRPADAAAALAAHLRFITAALDGPQAHLIRMLLMPHAARIAELAADRRRITTAVTL
jgi:hypothetical protein